MIFIGGISSGSRELPFSKTVICSQCGAYGRYQVFMTYMYFSFFFIPLFKWNKRYFVKMSCCQAVYELDQEKGRQIARGVQEGITEQDLTLIQAGGGNPYRKTRDCANCGYEAAEDFEFCPKCGSRL